MLDHFVLDLAESLANVPMIAGYQIERLADKVLSVAVQKNWALINYLVS